MKKNKEIVRKPVDTKMYWWLNINRPFYIGDEYRIDLVVRPFSFGSAVKIVVTNLKNCEDRAPEADEVNSSKPPVLLKSKASNDQDLFLLKASQK